MSKPNSGARYEIAIDGTTRTHRDRKDMALAPIEDEIAAFQRNGSRP